MKEPTIVQLVKIVMWQHGDSTLAVNSDWHDYEAPGRYAIVVKVIDIFGNDTTKLAEVVVK